MSPGNFLGVEVLPDGSAEHSPSVPKSEFARARRNSCTTTCPRPPAVPAPENNWVSEPKVHDRLPEEPQGLGYLKPKSHNFSRTDLSQSLRSVQTAQTAQTNFSTFSGNSINDEFFDLLHRHMANRYDDQRAPLPVVKEETRSPPTSPPTYPPVSNIPRQFTNTPVRPKPKRATKVDPADAQAPLRAFMPPISANLSKPRVAPGGNSEIWRQLQTNKLRGAPSAVSVTDSEESFFQLVSRMQGNRLDDQRSSMPIRMPTGL